MKGDKGTCLFFDDEQIMVNKTKFDTKEHCDERIEDLLFLGVINPITRSYKCKVCGFWHTGKPEQVKKYSK